MNHKEFTAKIGVEVKGELWTCIEMPDSAEFFGKSRSKRADIKVDDVEMPNVGFLPTGTGSYMFSLNAAIRKKLGKDIGDTVDVKVSKI